MNQELLRFEEKQSCFRGSAKINLKHLQFENGNSGPLFLNPKNISRLLQIFRLEGCLRYHLEHHIPATINENELNHILQNSNASSSDLFRQQTPPLLNLDPNAFLRCLHGRHRIEAAKDFLLPGDKWWIVDLYSDRLTEHVRIDITNEYSNALNFCDGDIFRQLRFSQQQNNKIEEGHWLARLSESKRKDVLQLQRRKDLQLVATALDNLLSYVGLWPSLQIGTFHRILNLRCPEELQNYLHHIQHQWNIIIGDHQFLLDFQTVKLLQTRNPHASKSDRDFIDHHMEQHKLFPMVTDILVRTSLLNRLHGVSCMIPSLFTFFEDTKWLEPSAKVIRGLLSPRFGYSIRQSLFKQFDGFNQKEKLFRIETPNQNFVFHHGNEREAVEASYRQLWMFAWRHFPDLVAIAPRKNVGKPKPQVKTLNEQYQQKLAHLAKSLGFESKELNNLQLLDPDVNMVLNFLHQARPSEFYKFSENTHRKSVLEICQILQNIQKNDTVNLPKPISAMEIPVEHRCGRPHELSHQITQNHFFMQNLYHEPFEPNLSYFSVNRDIFLAFFGRSANIEPPHNINPDDMNPEFEQHYIDSNNMNLDFEQPETGKIQPSQPELLMTELRLFIPPFPQPLTQSTTQPMEQLLTKLPNSLIPQPMEQSIGQFSGSLFPQPLSQSNTQSIVQSTSSLFVPLFPPTQSTTQAIGQSTAQFPLQHHFSSLSEAWKFSSKNGSIFTVDCGTLAWQIFYMNDQKTIKEFQDWILSYANDHCFLTYHLSTLSLKTVRATTIMETINQYCFKDECQDGVIYALPKSLNVNFCGKKGVSTIQLLDALQQQWNKQQHDQVQQEIGQQEEEDL